LCGESRSRRLGRHYKGWKRGKAMGYDFIPIEMWIDLKDIAIVQQSMLLFCSTLSLNKCTSSSYPKSNILKFN
jgi:hypothetical protein